MRPINPDDMKANAIFWRKDVGLVRVAGWLPSKIDLVYQLVTPKLRWITSWAHKVSFVKKDYYYRPMLIADFEKEFQVPELADIEEMVKL